MNLLPITVRRALHLLRHNPALLAFKLEERWQARKRFAGGTLRLADVVFACDPSLDPMVASMAAGTYAADVRHVMRRCLKPGDVFIDAGANIGYVSAYALSLVGKSGQVHAFEPVPKYFARLENLRAANPGFQFFANPFALGSTPGTASIHVTRDVNIGWNTMVPGFMATETIGETIEVPVKRLDDYMEGHGLRKVKLIKIDTEGFEFPVLLGLSRYLEGCTQKPWIICEVARNAFPRLGHDIQEMDDYMKGFGYQARHVESLERLQLKEIEGTADVLFVPGNV